MVERFARDSQRVVLGAEQVDPEHLLLALVEGDSPAARAIAEAGMDAGAGSRRARATVRAGELPDALRARSRCSGGGPSAPARAARGAGRPGCRVSRVLVLRGDRRPRSLGTYDVVFDGAQVAIADPLGMDIREPNLELFSFAGGPLPPEWVRFSRGVEGHFQRLVFGPPDDHEALLDDITISVGASDEPLTGG